MGEKQAVKNNDCYFYYYSSCSKGAACPFRHEPAALRNETTCIYWMNGNCNKSNCIFRHMEITKKRDKIACWFESQPGGCKKPHCPFQHQNILNHPREEDIVRQPDLILPVKKEETAQNNGSANSLTTTLTTVTATTTIATPTSTVVGGGGAGGAGGRDGVAMLATEQDRVRQLAAATKTPIIVPLHDGESDTESITSPSKDSLRPNPEHAWEVERLRQIQDQEAGLIGYTFTSAWRDSDATQEPARHQEEEEEEEEYIVEQVVEDAGGRNQAEAAHPHLSAPDLRCLLSRPAQSTQRPTQRPTQLSPRSTPCISTDIGSAKTPPRPTLTPHPTDLRHTLKNRVGRRVGVRVGGVAGRALADTLGLGAKKRSRSQPSPQKQTRKETSSSGSSTLDFEIKSLDEIRAARRRNISPPSPPSRTSITRRREISPPRPSPVPVAHIRSAASKRKEITLASLSPPGKRKAVTLPTPSPLPSAHIRSTVTKRKEITPPQLSITPPVTVSPRKKDTSTINLSSSPPLQSNITAEKDTSPSVLSSTCSTAPCRKDPPPSKSPLPTATSQVNKPKPVTACLSSDIAEEDQLLEGDMLELDEEIDEDDLLL